MKTNRKLLPYVIRTEIALSNTKTKFVVYVQILLLMSEFNKLVLSGEISDKNEIKSIESSIDKLLDTFAP